MTRRIDASLNDERIVTAARRVLGEDPHAGMDALAAAAGVGRATLYRRYSTRDELLAQLRAEARHEAYRAVKEAEPERGSARDALERMVTSLLHVADRFAFLTEATRKQAPDQKLSSQLLALVERGQAAGEFSADVPAEWWLPVIQAHFREAARVVASGTPIDDAAARMTRALLGGMLGN